MAKDRSTNATSADASTPAPSPSSGAPTPADTSEAVATIAGKYADFQWADLMAVSCSDETGALDRFCSDVRSMAASLLRQNER